MVFGAIGMVTSLHSETIENSAYQFKSGMGLRNANAIRDSCPMSDPTCSDYKPESTDIFFENIGQAFILIVEALKALKFINYISFALSLVFLVLYLKPLLFGKKSRTLPPTQSDLSSSKKVKKSKSNSKKETTRVHNDKKQTKTKKPKKD